MYPPLTGATINSVFLSPAFTALLYGLGALVLVFGTLFYLKKKTPFFTALRKASVVVFFSAGLIYALNADIGWSTWLVEDFRTNAGLSTDDKILRLEGGLYDFIRQARNVLPDTYRIYSTDSGASVLAEYYLLPKRKKPDAEYIVVLYDDLARLDPASRRFSHDGVVFDNVDIVLGYAGNAYIVRYKR